MAGANVPEEWLYPRIGRLVLVCCGYNKKSFETTWAERAAEKIAAAFKRAEGEAEEWDARP
jgi:hypothetical protein